MRINRHLVNQASTQPLQVTMVMMTMTRVMIDKETELVEVMRSDDGVADDEQRNDARRSALPGTSTIRT